MTDTCAFANDDLTVSLVLGLKKKKSETGNSHIFFVLAGHSNRAWLGVCTCYVFRHYIPPLFLSMRFVCVCAVYGGVCTWLGADETTRKL